jgi:hypothetical protein
MKHEAADPPKKTKRRGRGRKYLIAKGKAPQYEELISSRYGFIVAATEA